MLFELYVTNSFQDSLRICIRFPLFEKILMEPLREPLRPFFALTGCFRKTDAV
jgi:hypothetical protein